jgi:hypothetical protein
VRSFPTTPIQFSAQTTSFSRRLRARGVLHSRPHERARGTPGARCTHGLCADAVFGKTNARRTSGFTGTSRRSARGGASGLLRALPDGNSSPGTETVLHAGWHCRPSAPYRPDGRQGTTRLEPARMALRRAMTSRSSPVCAQRGRPRFRRWFTTLCTKYRPPTAFRARRCRVTASRLAYRDDREPPLSVRRDIMGIKSYRIIVNGRDSSFRSLCHRRGSRYALIWEGASRGMPVDHRRRFCSVRRVDTGRPPGPKGGGKRGCGPRFVPIRRSFRARSRDRRARSRDGQNTT